MKKLWAPWRTGYITSIPKKKGCFLCIGASRKSDEKRYIVRRSKSSFAILNLFPYNNGHLMVAPYRHTGSLEELTQEEILDMARLVIEMKRLLDLRLKPGGYNIGLNIGRAGGAGVEHHIHIHIVPRWFGDTNFMPILSDTKIVSESLRDLYCRLKGGKRTRGTHAQKKTA